MDDLSFFEAGEKGEHLQGCICVRCEAMRDVEALERLFESLDCAQLRQAAGVVLTQAIVRLREKAGRA